MALINYRHNVSTDSFEEMEEWGLKIKDSLLKITNSVINHTSNLRKIHTVKDMKYCNKEMSILLTKQLEMLEEELICIETGITKVLDHIKSNYNLKDMKSIFDNDYFVKSENLHNTFLGYRNDAQTAYNIIKDEQYLFALY